MLSHDDLWALEELPLDDTSDILSSLPELRHVVAPERAEELGFRGLLEQPEALSRVWRLSNRPRKRPPAAERLDPGLGHAA
jgi:hypothetical protein